MTCFRTLSLCLCLFATPILAQLGPVSLSVGVKGGIPLTSAIRDGQSPLSLADFLLGYPSGATYSSSKNFLIGPSLEVHLPAHLSVELDALYQPLTIKTEIETAFPSAGPINAFKSDDYMSWEIPVLVKYEFPIRIVKPFLSAGPSFRVLDAPLSQWFSAEGVAAAAGVSSEIKRFKFGPEVRFIHWGNDSNSTVAVRTGNFSNTGVAFISRPYNSVRNQVELLFGLSF